MDRNIGAGARPRHRGGGGGGGGGRRGRGRVPNPPNNPQQHGGQEPDRRGQRQQEEENLGEFGDMSEILKDWRDIAFIIGPVLNQKAAAHNIYSGGKCFIEVSINDLVKKIRKDTKDMEIGSLKKCFKIIRFPGIAKKSPTSVQNDELAQQITWGFESEENADMTFIETKLNDSPVGIIIDIDAEFGALRKGIYKVRRVQPDISGSAQKHALLITGYGRTRDGRHFLILLGEH